ncbi:MULTISPECIES: hypothetical protein [unclassified Fusibacter]|uniref:hypothetical protein n=1 Tax=unclassified Fusibacter TaxID=2624464 RepID=UPI001013636F|nr:MULTISPECIES: hypothetical protein [unclassified Fusibacter]MCK8060397.1 hypothetical protein [Fusibacter sp. A2]NPE20314.1 hypothetical protein [Fusibacter sp. A1]RXV63520.1 hypothetical protein DWB64_00680 [Fusibacter sp. A1]
MNAQKLSQAEEQFFMRYPDGFDSPEMIAIGKKHRMDKLIEFAHQHFHIGAFEDVDTVIEDMIAMVNKSSMVSLFEKPKFRDAVRSMTKEEKQRLAIGLEELLHENEEEGFNLMLEVLAPYKMAKWTIMTVFSCYYYPERDLLFKPTTVKNVIDYFELQGLKYTPKPNYEFFKTYRKVINEMKTYVHSSLAPNNASFSGFLMMSMDNR